ncbi:MAG: trypsin-like peptidase domain-containing protein [Actinomycetota bacterium]
MTEHPSGPRRLRRRHFRFVAGGVAGIMAVMAALAWAGTFTTSRPSPAAGSAAAAGTAGAPGTRAASNPNVPAPLAPGAQVAASPPAGTSPSLDIRAVLRAVEPAVVDITDFAAPSGGASRATGQGTGMILDAQGTVLTNAHVVSGATTLSVRPFGQSVIYQAKVLGVDTIDDVALIQIQNPGTLTPVTLGPSAGVQVGDPVVAVGNALGLSPGGPTVTSGIISALNRSLSTSTGTGAGTEHLTGLFQTDAPINPGNSGGPLVDASGKVIGMNTAVSTDGQNVGFAIPTDRITPVLDSLRKGATPSSTQGFLGVTLGPAASGGAQITQVLAGSPAATAGLLVGDVITAVNGVTTTSTSDAAAAISSTPAGAKVTLTIQRGGATQTVTATLGSKTA